MIIRRLWTKPKLGSRSYNVKQTKTSSLLLQETSSISSLNSPTSALSQQQMPNNTPRRRISCFLRHQPRHQRTFGNSSRPSQGSYHSTRLVLAAFAQVQGPVSIFDRRIPIHKAPVAVNAEQTFRPGLISVVLHFIGHLIGEARVHRQFGVMWRTLLDDGTARSRRV